MGQQKIGSILAAAFLGIGPCAHYCGHAMPSPDPSPTVLFAATSPILSQQSPRTWTTTVLVDSSPSCLSGLKFQLLTTSPDSLTDGSVTDVVPLPPAGSAVRECGNATGQFEAVSLIFSLKKPFPTVPLEATLVVDQPDGTAAPAAEMTMTIHRLVTRWQYLWIPIICGAALAMLYLAIVGAVPLGLFLMRRPAGFWRQPMYASAAWTFRDSWATNIATAGTTIAAILTGLGSVSTLVPGVQLDRYAVLITICGAIIVAAPLVFGIAYTLSSRTRPQVPGNAQLEQEPAQPAPQWWQPQWTIRVPGGASITFPGGAHLPANHEQPPVDLKAGATLPVPPGQITVAGGTPVLPGDETIVLKGASTMTVQSSFTVAADAVLAPPAAAPGPAAPAAASVRLRDPVTVQGLSATNDAVTVKVAGCAYLDIPQDTRVTAPDCRQATIRTATSLRVPLGTNVIVSDMRSLIPAAMITMFGIGAELGLLGVLAGWLSAETGGARIAVVTVTGVIVVVLLWYAWSTTHAVKDARPGSALTPDSHVSATL
jgi:hypothetical protein